MRWRDCRCNSVPLLVFACVSIFLFLFFTLFYSKNEVYIERMRKDQMEQKYNV